jgi:hypothetical protein
VPTYTTYIPSECQRKSIKYNTVSMVSKFQPNICFEYYSGRLYIVVCIFVERSSAKERSHHPPPKKKSERIANILERARILICTHALFNVCIHFTSEHEALARFYTFYNFKIS